MTHGARKLMAGAVAVALIGGCSAADEPISPQEYAKVLAEVDTSLTEPFAALAEGDKAAYTTAAQSLRTGADRFADLTPPTQAQVTQDSLVSSLRELSYVVEDAGTSKRACPAGSPSETVLTSEEAEHLRAATKELSGKDASYAFGGFLPVAPKQQKRQLKNGAFIKKDGTGGVGELEIKNGSADTTVSLVGKDPKKPLFTVYVRGGGKHVVEGIKSGTYQVYTASGVDWDAGKKGFTRDCGFSKFDDKFKFDSSGTRWTITLETVKDGNATTTEVDPNAFPNG